MTNKKHIVRRVVFFMPVGEIIKENNHVKLLPSGTSCPVQ